MEEGLALIPETGLSNVAPAAEQGVAGARVGGGDLQGLPSLPDPSVPLGTCQSPRDHRFPLPALPNGATLLRWG